MKWVTRERARVDRIACPWLISRFIDKEPTFLFVPSDQVKQVAAREGAIPYDIPGVELGHHGERCSFDAFLEKYKLEDAALKTMALIVRGADTDARQLTPESPGLYALARLPSDGQGRPRQYGETVPRVRRAVRLLPCEGEVTEASVRSESRRALGQRGRRKTERESEGELPVGDAAREPLPEARVEPHVLRRSGLPDDTEARNRAGSHAGVSLRSPRRRGALPSRREAHRLVPRSSPYAGDHARSSACSEAVCLPSSDGRRWGVS